MTTLTPLDPAFWCEGCRRRVPGTRLYSRQAAIDLAKGQAIHRDKHNQLVYYPMTCSKRCSRLVAPRRYLPGEDTDA